MSRTTTNKQAAKITEDDEEFLNELKTAVEVDHVKAEEDASLQTQEAEKQPKKGKVAVSTNNIQALHNATVRTTKDKLDAEPTRQYYIALGLGEKKGQASETIGTNGYFITVPKGQYVSVPESIATRLDEIYQLGSSIGEDFEISRDDKTMNALA